MISAGDVLLGKYRIERELGRGAMGVVLAARHLDLDESVAIKMLQADGASNEEIVRRFMREARAAAKIKGDHVVKVSDVGRLPSGEPYMVMELLDGTDLEKLLAKRGPLPVAETMEFAIQALEAVAEAHASGIVHRDLKPANMFLTHKRNGAACIKVLDFGISKFAGGSGTGGGQMTRTQGGLMGSPLYMSPEQLKSAKDVDARADIWSVGVILFQLLTGRFPFIADTLAQLVVQVISEPPARLRELRPDVHPDLEAAICRCLEKDRDRRFPNVTQLAQALGQFASGQAQLTATAIGNVLAVNALPTIAVVDMSPTAFPATAIQTPAPFSAVPFDAPVQGSTLAPLGNTKQPTALQSPVSAASRGRWKLWAAIGAAITVLTAGGAIVTSMASGGKADGGKDRASGAGSSASAPTASLPKESNAKHEEEPTPTPALASSTPSSPASSPPPSRDRAKPAAASTPSIDKRASGKSGDPKSPALAPSSSPAAAPSALVSPPTPKLDCDPPYTIDSDGVRVPKPGCR